MKLKYLFEAYFADGHRIIQDLDDISSLDPARSTFYDVLQYESTSELVLFGLYLGKNTYVVDLLDGHFEVNGVPFSAQPVALPEMIEGGKFKLLYCRDHQQELILSENSSKPGKHSVQYRFGWEYTDPRGKVYNQTLVLV